MPRYRWNSSRLAGSRRALRNKIASCEFWKLFPYCGKYGTIIHNTWDRKEILYILHNTASADIYAGTVFREFSRNPRRT